MNNLVKNISMGFVDVNLIADVGLFKGLANQNMLFHQCVCELIDNSIAQKRLGVPFKIILLFEKVKNSDNYYLYIIDNSKGMSCEILAKAMQPGQSATIDNRLNEHGFGLKHSLATLTKKTGDWKIWSKDLKEGNISSVHSPFQHKMQIKDDDYFPELPIEIPDISTIVRAEITLGYFQSVQISRGAKTTSITRLIEWLVEHLGVTYRGYLSQNPDTLDIDGMITVIMDTTSIKVPPIEIPMESTREEIIQINLEGKNYDLIYKSGLLDESKRDRLLNNKGLKAYYQGNQETQGIDIRLGKRVIATKQLTNIFGVKSHPKYNIFVAELLIPELPREVLKTVNNKTDIDFDDPDWNKIFDTLRKDHPLPEDARFAQEEELRVQLINNIKGTDKDDEVLHDAFVWFNGVKIDVFRKRHDTKDIYIYELKVGKGVPLNVYQLKMYWDGLVQQKTFPKYGILICEEFDSKLQDMVNAINAMKPQEGANPYNFSLQTIADARLVKQPKKKKNP